MPQETSFKIDSEIFEAIKEEHRQFALAFFEYLKSNKMSIRGNKIIYKGKRMGGIGVFNDNMFQLSIQTQFDEPFYNLVSKESEAVKALVKEQSAYTGCGRCIIGKCAATHLNMGNPDKHFYNFAQKLLALRCDAISNEQVPKCNYIKISDRGKMIKCAKCKVCNPACRKLKNF